MRALLETTTAGLRGYADLNRTVLDADNLCVVPNRKDVAENAEPLAEIRPLKARL